MTDFRALLKHPLLAPVVNFVGDPRQRPRMLAAISGLLIAFAQPPFGFLPGLLGYGLLLYALECDLGNWPKRTAFFMGWLAGFCYFFVSCFWVAEAFLVDAETYGWMAIPAAMLLPAGIGLFWGLFALIYTKMRPANWTRFVYFAALFSLLEMTRGSIMSGFPWNPAGSTWKAGSALSQMAAYVGVYGLGFVTVLVFSSVGIVRRGRGVSGYAPAVFGALVLAGCFGVGEYRLNTVQIRDTGYIIRYVQPAVGQEAKWDARNFAHLFNLYVRMSKTPPEPGHRVPDLIIWPEGALPVTWENLTDQDTWTLPVMANLLAENQSLMIGTTKQEPSPKGGLVWRNAMLVLNRKGGQEQIIGQYNKYKLVPFGEFTPYQDILNPLGMSALTHFDDSFTPGERTKPHDFTGIPRVLPMICYEGIFPSLDMTRYKQNDILRPKWIVNISNDAWFGPTTGPVQHLNLASFRAIEEGLPMVRSTPTGISAVIDPLGRVVPGTATGLGVAGYKDINLPAPANITAYAMQRFAYLGFVLCLFLGLTVPKLQYSFVNRLFLRKNRPVC
ncbi:MAG: apolipoprotein N-acyltransferase [Asticcacaulis sp.]|uniref:apolipoprotein N-acyltransferase n=1 Tax=Asticcacaulis sp. TaxID=1872648 RepID=UPI0039E6441A